MIEHLDPAQPWEIPLPHTWEDRERVLEAREGSDVVAIWTWNADAGMWDGAGYGTRLRDSYPNIVKHCMEEGYRLYSLPGGDTGDAR